MIHITQMFSTARVLLPLHVGLVLVLRYERTSRRQDVQLCLALLCQPVPLILYESKSRSTFFVKSNTRRIRQLEESLQQVCWCRGNGICSTWALSTACIDSAAADIHHRQALLWRFCDSGAAYKTPHLLTYLLTYLRLGSILAGHLWSVAQPRNRMRMTKHCGKSNTKSCMNLPEAY